jgi:hypothetical protein
VGGKRVKGNTGKATAAKQVTEPPDSAAPSSKHLVWRFGRLDHETEFGCHTLLSTDVRALEKELEVFQEEPIWRLRALDWLKFIPIDEMTPAGQAALVRVNKQESGLWQLHLHSERWRIYGYFRDPEYYFLWWDGEKKVATGKSRKRNA